MKKILIMLAIIVIGNSCKNEFDDSTLWNSINGLEDRVAKLEELCKQMNTNISSLQEIVTALQKNESIKSVATLPDGSGYLITFSSGKSITIYHGKNGTNGEDGKDGQNGTNGITPVISIKKDTDGIYYWTINNEWLLVDGKKVKAEGTDGEPGKGGEDGTNGKDGITPQFKITDGYWYISYDNESSWTKLGKATGDSGLNGADGDNFFKGVSIEVGYVCFTLNDKDSTVIKLPFVSESELTVEVREPGTLNSLLTLEQKRSLINIKVTGEINKADIRTIDNMNVIEVVDLSETIYAGDKDSEGYFIEGMFNVNPRNEPANGNRTLRVIISPKNIKHYDWCFTGCKKLEKITFIKDSVRIGGTNFNGSSYLSSYFQFCYNLHTVEFAEGITYIPNYSDAAPNIVLPSTLKRIGEYAFGYKGEVVICKALTPPMIGPYYYSIPFRDGGGYSPVGELELKVPKESLVHYTTAVGWKDFKQILPIEE